MFTITFLLVWPTFASMNEICHQTLLPKRLSVDVNKFKTLSDNELFEQWGGRELNLKTIPRMVTLSKVSGLSRGDRVKMTRTLDISKEDLLALIKTRQVTSQVLHNLNYDIEALNEYYLKNGFTDLAAVLRQNRTYGRTAVSATYAVNGYGTTRNGTPLEVRNDHYSLQLELSVPVEAIVFRGKNYELPGHVRKSPWGFCIVSPHEHPEGEGTFVDFIPPEWIVTDLDSLAGMIR